MEKKKEENIKIQNSVYGRARRKEEKEEEEERKQEVRAVRGEQEVRKKNLHCCKKTGTRPAVTSSSKVCEGVVSRAANSGQEDSGGSGRGCECASVPAPLPVEFPCCKDSRGVENLKNFHYNSIKLAGMRF